MGLDVRLPIGLMFVTLGPILLAYGWQEDIALDRQVGVAMLAFGLAMLLPALWARRRPGAT